MEKIGLVRFLWETAGEAIASAENASSDTSAAFLDEAEELLALALSVLSRLPVKEHKNSEAA